MNIAVSCGGTGGHVFPGLVVTGKLKARGHNVTLWLAGKNIEGVSTGTWDGPVVTVRAEGMSSRSFIRSVLAVFRLTLATLSCIGRMRKDRPDTLLAMGSYASVGPVLAARYLGIPVVLHEANVVPGRAVRFLSRFAAAIAVSFEQTCTSLPGLNCVLTGFPVRPQFTSASAHDFLPGNAFTVLVTGGSQGAKALNEIASQAICRAADKGAGLEVIHLAGRTDEQAVRSRYERAGVRCKVFDFLSEIGRAYAAADLAISRAGAATCAELTTVRLPSLLVPYPFAINDHQTANAKALQAAGQADVIAEKDLTVEWLAGYITQAQSDSGKLARMKGAAANRQVDAADRLADLIEGTVQGKGV